MLRSYREQQAIPGFEDMTYDERRAAVAQERVRKIAEYKANKGPDALKALKKSYKNTEAYVHLTYAERKRFIFDLAAKIKGWSFLRIFAEIIDKDGYHPPRPNLTPADQAFERIVTRIEKYLSHISHDEKEFGLLIHDECESVKMPHAANMKLYQRRGTFKAEIKHIIETPLFVSSYFTNMVQVADFCAYALRRYFDAGEQTLYACVKSRADKISTEIVGLNHYTNKRSCSCDLCSARRRRKNA